MPPAKVVPRRTVEVAEAQGPTPVQSQTSRRGLPSAAGKVQRDLRNTKPTVKAQFGLEAQAAD